MLSVWTEQMKDLKGDERMDFFFYQQIFSPEDKANIENNHSSIVMVVHKDNVKDGKIKADLLKNRDVSYQYDLAENIRFGKQKSAFSTGSGFVFQISNDGNYAVIITAAHNVIRPSQKLEDFLFIHGVAKTNPQSYTEEGGIPVENYQIFKPIAKQNKYYLSEFGSDFAVLLAERSEKPAHETKKVCAVTIGELEIVDKLLIYSIGHGLGLPLKISYKGEVEKNVNPDLPYFEAKLSLLGGNSGSPIFHTETHQCIGMYIRGVKKFKLGKGDKLVIRGEEQDAELGESTFEGHECQKWDNIKLAYDELLASYKHKSKALTQFIEELKKKNEGTQQA